MNGVQKTNKPTNNKDNRTSRWIISATTGSVLLMVYA